MSIGNNIRNIRKEKGMTLQQIADIMGCSPQLISQYESGKRQPKLETLKKIATVLECEVSDINEHIYILHPAKITPEDIQDAEVRKILKKYESGETLTPEEQQKVIDNNKRIISKIKQREETAKSTPRWLGEGNEPKEGKAPKWTGTSMSHAPQEAYELLRSLIDKEGIDDCEREEVSQQLKKILSSFKGLNEIGRTKAVERIEELYMVPKYIFDNFPDEPPQE